MLDHQGNDLEKARELFAEPPAEIGEVISASSTLALTDKPSWLRRGWDVLVGRKYFVSYVGKLGLARIVLVGGRTGAIRSERLMFDDADYLRVAIVRHKRQSAYAQNSYEYRWHDRRDLGIFTIQGALADQPSRYDLYHFGRSAETAWSMHRLARYEQELVRDGSIVFPLHSGRVIRLADGYIELRGFGADPVRLARDELDSMLLTDGKFKIKHVDATWYGKGKFNIDYESVANAQLFITMTKRLLGKDAT